MYYVFVFLFWTFVIYWMHRLVHIVPVVNKIHADHHRYVIRNTVKWHWSNLFLYNDTWLSTLDLWISEVIPTMVFAYFFGIWIFALYYVWAAFVQERIEHNENFDWYPFLTSGKWHMIHHKHSKVNYGIFFPIWDIMFKTYEQFDGHRK